MNKFTRILALTALLAGLHTSTAADQPKPLRALMITGGCCHDYEAQKVILSEGISQRANVEWTIIHEGGTTRDHRVSVYEKPDWAKGYDVVLHNECFGGITDADFVNQIAKPHLEGVPAVVLHCSMHSYRAVDEKTDAWRRVLGVTSVRHQQKDAVSVVNLKPEHPVMKGFPGPWMTPNGELYEIVKLWPTTTPLGQAFGTRTMKDHVCVWANEHGKGRTFGTTIGHHNETMETKVYLDLVTRGLLWSCDKLDESGQPKAGYGPKEKKEKADK